MAVFKVPSATPSPTSSQGSTRRSPGRVYKVPSASTSSTSSDSDTARSPVLRRDLRAASPHLEKPSSAASESHTSGREPSPAKVAVAIESSPEEEDGDKLETADRVADKHPGPSSDAGRAKPVSQTAQLLKARLDHANIVPFSSSDADRPRSDASNLTWNLEGAITLGDLMLNAKESAAGHQYVGLPESLVWQTLISLLSATHFLHTGEDRPNRTPDKDISPWSVIHNSINPDSIFYVPREDGSLELDTFSACCMLGDFSASVVLPLVDVEDADEDGDNQQQSLEEAFAHIHAAGEQTGYEPPELVGDTGDLPGPASDLWSIGAVMVTIMTGRPFWDVLIDIGPRKLANQRPGGTEMLPNWRNQSITERIICLIKSVGYSQLTQALPHRYDPGLRILVEGLLSCDPIERGCAIDVLEDVGARFKIRAREFGPPALLSGSWN